MNRLHTFFLLSMTVLLLGACSGKDKTSEPQTEETPTDSNAIRIAVLPTSDADVFEKALAEGLFEKQGLSVRLVPFTAHMDVDTALIGGSVDGAFTDRVRVKRLNELHKELLTEVCQTDLRWSLMTNRRARLNRKDQFSEKMVAMTRYSATDELTDSVFSNVKLKSTYFKVQINDVNVRLNMLLDNQMDAAWLPEPLATVADSAGHRRLIEGQTGYGVLVMRTEYLKKADRKLAEKLAAIYKESEDSMR